MKQLWYSITRALESVTPGFLITVMGYHEISVSEIIGVKYKIFRRVLRLDRMKSNFSGTQIIEKLKKKHLYLRNLKKLRKAKSTDAPFFLEMWAIYPEN